TVKGLTALRRRSRAKGLAGPKSGHTDDPISTPTQWRQRVSQSVWRLAMDTPKRPTIVPTFPSTLYLEATNRCDSECQTCLRTFNTLEPAKDLTLAEVQRLVEQCPGLERVVLHGIGEPLLNKQIFDIVAYLKARGVTVLFNSDAISLT